MTLIHHVIKVQFYLINYKRLRIINIELYEISIIRDVEVY